VLLSLTFTLHYLIMTQILPAPVWSPGALWAGFGIIGSIGSVLIGRNVGRAPGSSSMINRVEGYVWMMFATAACNSGR